MIRQPIVYKPSNPRYLDAYTEKLNLEKKEAAKLQREREKERKAEQDKLGMYTNRKYASPVHQRAYDTYIKDFKAKAEKEPENFSFLLNETSTLIKGLDAENKSFLTTYNEAIKSGDYRNMEEVQNALMTYDGGDDFDAYNRGGVMKKVFEPLNKLQKSFALGEYISNQGNDILKNLTSDPKTLSLYFDRDIREKDLDNMTMTEIFTSIKPEAVEEVMGIILSSNPEAMSQAEFDYSRGIENEQEKRDNAINMATQDLQKFLGVASITKTLKKGEDDGESGFNYLGDNEWRNAKFSFVRGETKKGRTPKFQEEVDTDFISVEKRNPTSDVPIQEYFYEGQNIKGRVKGIEKVGNTTYAVVPTTIDVPKVINGKEYPNSKVKKRVDARVELDPTYNLSIFTNAYKISPSQLESMFSNERGETQSNERGETQSNERGETQSGNVGYNNPKNKRFPPPPPSMGQ